MARHIHGHEKSRLRAIDDARVQIFLGCVRDGVQQEIQPTPLLAHALEHGVELSRLAYVARQDDRAGELLRQRSDVRLGFRVQVRERELGASRVKGFRTAIRDAVRVGDADDKAPLGGQIEQVHVLTMRPCARAARLRTVRASGRSRTRG
jgi:hypothetical protein